MKSTSEIIDTIVQQWPSRRAGRRVLRKLLRCNFADRIAEEAARYSEKQCGAKTRVGTPCRRKGLANGKCRNHRRAFSSAPRPTPPGGASRKRNKDAGLPYVLSPNHRVRGRREFAACARHGVLDIFPPRVVSPPEKS